MNNTKKRQLTTAMVVLVASLFSTLAAQEVSTLYFLENSPMRHQVNPAFQPVSDGYVNLTPLGYFSTWAGNNSLTTSDVVYNLNGSTVTALHPDADRSKLLKQIRKISLADESLTMDLLNFGFRHKEKGYVYVSVMEKIESGLTTPKAYYDFFLNGGMKDPTGTNSFDLSKTGARINMYTEIAGGYSYKINDQWTVGGKLKVLLGTLNLTMLNNSLLLDAGAAQWHLQGEGVVQIAAPINTKNFPSQINFSDIKNANLGQLTEGMSIMDYVMPQGYGAGIDAGFTYKPHPQVQVTAALNDLGFIVWKGASYNMAVDSVYTGAQNLVFSDYSNEYNNFGFDTKQFSEDITQALVDYANSIRSEGRTYRYARMLSAKLNVGVDANFLNNLLGVGIVSKTRLFNGRLYEEVTLGGAVRPCNWFNFALSYSLVNNGKFSNIGAGLSFMPYDGINLTLALDYIPTSYVAYNGAPIPYKSKGMNAVLGFSIVWGTNKKKDADKDGVPDKWDLCPETPLNVVVDSIGCPVDEDGDGVPDYLDQCPGTPDAARGLIDSTGCPIDTDNDGVPDYRDQCFTLPEAVAYVDSLGCDKDSDGDGVPDYKDSCATLPEAVMFVDSLGCDKDSDGDGVPDYRDSCITLPEAIAYVDALGCDKDTDGDSVPDYLDECPTVYGLAENKGCPAIQKEVRNLLKKAMKGIQFETGKDVITKSSYNMLDLLAQIFIENPAYIIEVQGHTDNTGKADKNLTLSQLRAEAVMKYLINAGVSKERISAKGYGDQRPIADNATKDGRAQNRRVEFDITFEQVTYETHLEHAEKE